MQKISVLYRAAVVVCLAAAPQFCRATDTRVWEQSEQADFAKGTLKKLSIRSDGHITLAPGFKELDSTNTPYLWALVQDSKGTLYYAGGAPTGATTKIYALTPGGKSKGFAELTGLEVHALAVDRQDRLYAAVLPDAKIYRIDSSGKAQVFFDPKCKYIWAMTFDKAGNLFVATGDAGLIYKVTPDGKGGKFFDTEETHARSMIIDDSGNLIVGTEPSGLVMRITPEGKSFVLYQTDKREVTALAERDGVIYAASVGNKTGTTSVSGASPLLPITPPGTTPAGTPRSGTPPPSLPPAVGSLSASVSGGSEFFRIQKDGFAERIWSSPSDLVYAVAFDASGKPILGTGNKGLIYRVDSDQMSTQLLNAPPTQVTAFLQSRNKGVVYAVTGNVGNVYEIGPGTEMSGTLDSEVLDAGEFSHWGRVHLTPFASAAGVSVETRSGNVSNPENNWTDWTKVDLSETGGQVQSPSGRFLQYRLTLHCPPSGDGPTISTIDVAYLPKNVAPKIGAVEIAPFNYREAPSTSTLERNMTSGGSPLTVTLPAVGQKRPSNLGSLEGAGNATLQYNKGYVTVRWSASDPNGDSLIYRVEIRGTHDSTWQPLKDKLQDRYYAFDSSAFPDGKYIARVTASDSPGNTAADALSSSLDSEEFTIDNTPPEIMNISAGQGTIRFTAKDALSWIDKAEYSVDGGDWKLLMPEHLVTDSQVLTYAAPVQTGQMITVRVFDENDNVVVRQLQGR
ncbi:MAG TPA: hypothetical protein VH302_10895 [Bryobacteraceae bacterium]|nr:hypothetical protein [Bryobacteraceae bacterium]